MPCHPAMSCHPTLPSFFNRPSQDCADLVFGIVLRRAIERQRPGEEGGRHPQATAGRASARRPPSGSLPRSTVIALQRLAQRRLYRSIKVAIVALFATRDAEQTALVPRVHVGKCSNGAARDVRHTAASIRGLAWFSPLSAPAASPGLTQRSASART
jgi:hypothetical protein